MSRYRYKKAHRIRKRKSILRRPIFWLVFFILIILGFSFLFLFFSSFFQTKNIEISGNQKVPPEALKEIVVEKINNKIVFYDSRSIFLVNLKGINKKIMGEFPQIAEVNSKKKFPDSLIFEVKERVPVGTWCKENDCFYLDKEGIIFEKSQQKIEPLIKCEVAKELGQGQPILEKKYLEALLQINKELKENLKIEVKEFLVSGDSKKLNIETIEGWQIFFDLTENIKEQIFNLDLVLRENIPLEKRKNLEYINLRFGNRVYYKFKD